MTKAEDKKHDAEVKAAEDKAAADRLESAATIAAEVKRDEQRAANDRLAAEAKIAANVKTLEFYKAIVLPITLAALAAFPGLIAAWRINAAEIRLTEVQRVGVDTHTLVNSAMGAQLKINVVALARVAKLTEDPEDIAALDLAKKLLAEHEAKQKTVDQRPTK